LIYHQTNNQNEELEEFWAYANLGVWESDIILENSAQKENIISNNNNIIIAELFEVLTYSVNNYRQLMQKFFDENPLPLNWERLNAKHLEISRICQEYIYENLNSDKDFILKCFKKEICEYEKVNDEIKLVGGIFKEEFCSKNSLLIISYNKNELDTLWKEKILKLFEGTESAKFFKKFINEFEILKNAYFEERAFSCLEPERTEAYNEWCSDKHIDSLLKRTSNLKTN
jgi:hypothetical protein